MHQLPNIEKKYDLMVLISGPEPQRTVFEDIMRSQLYQYQGTSLLVRGKPSGTDEIKTAGKMSEVDFLDTEQLNVAIQESDLIVSRSGYSTIMDLARLGKNAIFVPTPGQTEQIYLAKQLNRRGICFYKEQEDFKLARALSKIKLYTGFRAVKYDNDILEEVILKVLR
jgi:UDP-N-acetylglucosamine:LPS N-acetylglucosamine transferase